MNERIQRLLNDAHYALTNGRLGSATIAIRKILKQQPEQIEALLCLAKIQQTELQFDLARQTLKTVMQCSTLNHIQLNTLAVQLNQMELYFLLADTLSRLVDLQPNSIELRTQYALCLSKVGRIDQFIEVAQSCLKGSTGNPMLILNLGHGFKAKGLSADAAKQYKEFIKLRLDLVGTGYWSLADLKDYRFTDQDISNMDVLLSKLQFHEQSGERALLGFALARASEQRNQHEKAFSYLTQANSLMARSRPFKSAGFDHLVKSFCEITLSTAQGNAHNYNHRPIFIVGMPRSGTTLTEQILASHSEVKCTDELPFMERIAIQLSKGKSYQQGLAQITQEQRYKYGQFYVDQVQEYIGEHLGVYIDKNPTNFLHIGLILTLFPNAKIVALLRDPLDNGMSAYKQYFSKGNDFSYDLSHIQDYYSGYLTLLEHWRNISPQQILCLDYGKLVTEPQETIKQLLNFCELPFEQQCLTFYKSDRPVLTPSVSQVRQPINNKAIGSANAYRPFLSSEILEKFALLEQRAARLTCHDKL